MQTPEDKLLDKRLVYRHLRQGLITQAQYNAHIDGLPDVGERAAVVQVEVASVGLKNVAAKDTGEAE